MIQILGNKKFWRDALKAYSEMKANGLRPTVVTFNIMISACGKSGRWKEALEVLELMKEYSVEPNTITYNSLITACANGGQWEEAVRAFEAMRAAGVPADTITYSGLITACAKGGQWEGAVRVFEAMRAAGVPADTITYSTLIEATANSGKMDVALQFYGMGAQAGCFKNYQLVDDELPSNIGREASPAVASGDMASTGRGAIHTIDLHDLSEIGSQVCLLSWLRHLRRHREVLASSDVTNLDVVTGWGKHAEAGVSKVTAPRSSYCLQTLQLESCSASYRDPNTRDGKPDFTIFG